MSRLLRGCSAGWVTALVVIGLIINILILTIGKDRSSHEKAKFTIGKNEGSIEEPLPLPDLLKEDSLLLGKKLPKKVTLAVAMILRESCCGWYPFTKAVRELAAQDPRRDGSQSLVVVLLLVEKRRDRAKEILGRVQSDLNDLIKSGYVQFVVSSFDLKPQYLESVKSAGLKEVPSSVSLMNYRFAFLLKYCLQLANHAMLVESDSAIGVGAVNPIFKEIDNLKSNTLYVQFSESGLFFNLFNGKYLPRLYGTFYAMAQLGTPANIISTIGFVSVHAAKNRYSGDPIFHTAKLESSLVSNPPATITTNLLANGAYKAQNAYLMKGPSWFVTPKKGGHYTIKLNTPSKLKEVCIETGLDSSARDMFTGGVLEFSYNYKKDADDCNQYEAVASFGDNFIVDLSKDRSETEKFLAKPVSCIRIRIIEDFTAWASIKYIVLVEDK